MLFNSFGKVYKKLGEFDYCLWFDTVAELIKHQKWIFDNVEKVSAVVTRGGDVLKLSDVELVQQSGTLVNLNNAPRFIAHFSDLPMALGDFVTNSNNIFADTILSTFTKNDSKVLLVNPPFAIATADRAMTIVTTDSNYAQRELMTWEGTYGDSSPVLKA